MTSIPSLQPYASYKKCTSPWLGQVPEHWETARLKSRIENVIEAATDRKDDEPYIALEHVEGWTGIIRKSDPDVVFDSQVKRFRPGDILFGKLRPYLAKVTLAPKTGVCVGEFLVLRPFRSAVVSSAYLERLLRSVPVIDLVNSSTFGAKMPRADWQFVGNIEMLFPPIDEQLSIVRFLSYMDGQIRQYVRSKERLILLLNEQRQVLIQGAVTRGLDPRVRFKPSGVEWLGDVPEHWDVVRLGALLRERGEKNDDLLVTDVLSVMRARGVIPYAEKGNVGNKKSDDISRYKIVRRDDIVVNSMNVIIGSVGLSKYDGCLSPVYYVLKRRSETDNPHYLNAYFQTKPFQRSLVRIGYGILPHRMRIPMDLLKRELFPRPPASEQSAIVEYLDRATADLTSAIEQSQNEVSLLNEYHARLIADVVTGAINVREAAGRIPDELSRNLNPDEAEAPAEFEWEDDESTLDSLEEVEA